MSEFDDFAAKQDQEKLDKDQLVNDAKPEWEVLKGLVSQFALDNKSIGSDKFRWQNNPSQWSASLILGYVAATSMIVGSGTVFLSDAECSSAESLLALMKCGPIQGTRSSL